MRTAANESARMRGGESGFTLVEVVMTIVAVGIAAALGASALRSAVEIVRSMRTSAAPVLAVSSCMERLRAGFDGRALDELDRALAGKPGACGPDVTVTIETASYELDGGVLEVAPDASGDLRLVTVSNDEAEITGVFAEPVAAAAAADGAASGEGNATGDGK